ncbi:hypothetical protein T11_17551 [Trichinella zimbabwensis]|uniref:Uncharacterized protein n=1 Tax=Trichinella zimbabwensis TaxID=268475 RepID=A0A0V1H892_9BILA|nr:hypothetical protein T11_17551 [Trichinella zimbabwensis]
MENAVEINYVHPVSNSYAFVFVKVKCESKKFCKLKMKTSSAPICHFASFGARDTFIALLFCWLAFAWEAVSVMTFMGMYKMWNMFIEVEQQSYARQM